MTVEVLATGGWLDPARILSSSGSFVLPLMAAIVFAECGLLAGFFLPGDTLLFTAGLFVARGSLPYPIWIVCAVLLVSAFAGNVLGYEIGKRVGPKLFARSDSRLFKRRHVDRTHAFFERHGARAVVLARFVPVVRTFVTAMAGIGGMNHRTYVVYSFVGGAVWTIGVTVLGYHLGRFAVVQQNVELFVLGIALVSALPMLIEYLRTRRARETSP
ncbi:VTT domain-containing protein [Nocardia sp. NPDC052278]|uniref:VTT domain-containing protein n=1 Tax=unclassified Nocardia TaxID=2637762 RepID=UPI003685F85D